MPRIAHLAPWAGRSHEASRRGAGREAGPEIRPAHRGGTRSDPSPAGGAPGGAAARWQGLASPHIIARTRLGTGLANPSEWGLAKPIQARLRRCSEEMPSTTRGLANPWRLPAL